MTLADAIIAAVADNPGITTNVLCATVKVRKADVLADLERLRRERLLRVELGYRASKCWYLSSGQGNQFLTCSRSTPDDSGHAETETKS